MKRKREEKRIVDKRNRVSRIKPEREEERECANMRDTTCETRTFPEWFAVRLLLGDFRSLWNVLETMFRNNVFLVLAVASRFSDLQKIASRSDRMQRVSVCNPVETRDGERAPALTAAHIS